MNPAPLLAVSVPVLSAAGWVDAAVAVLRALSLVFGAVRGLAGEVSRRLAFGTGLAVLAVAYPFVRSFFPAEGEAHSVLAFAATVLLAAIAGAVVRAFARRFLKLLVGQPADSVIGAFLRLATTSIAVLTVFAFLRLLPIEAVRRVVFEESVSGRTALPLVERLVARVAERAALPGAAGFAPAAPDPATNGVPAALP